MRDFFVILCFLLSCWVRVDGSVSCVGGFGSKTSRVIPPERVNDGYCDCPLDAADEPLTDACSGSSVGGWPGVSGSLTASPTFVCPEQPNKKLPLSRLRDGICDCCDGADEPDGTCPDICEQVLAEERALRAKVEREFKLGYEQRQRDLQAFQDLVEKTTQELEKIDAQLEGVQADIDEAEQSLDDLKRTYMEQRMSAVQQIVSTLASAESTESLGGLLEPLSNEELARLLVHVCQLAGEMDDARDGSTCVPLRLAGIDIGIMWDDEQYADGAASLHDMMENESDQKVISHILDHNARSQQAVWTEREINHQKRSNRRRLEEDYYDEHMEDYDMDEFGDYAMDEDDHDDSNARDSQSKRPTSRKHYTTEKDKQAKQEIIEVIKRSDVSQWRVMFLERSSRSMERIGELTKESDEVDEEAEAEDTDSESEAESAAVDPMAFQMAKNTLSRRRERIERGFGYAASAKLLVDAVSADGDSAVARQRLMGLVSTTLYHSNITGSDLWQILRLILPEFATASAPTEEETCASAWMALCPPHQIERNGKPFPPPSVFESVTRFCEEVETSIESSYCAAETVEGDIPTDIPDGYFGYYTVLPRKDDDVLVAVFSPLHDIEPNNKALSQLETAIEDLESKRKSLRQTQKDLEHKMGGRSHSELGPDGELHSIRDQCFDVEAGKYVYEVCTFGSAAQRDKDGSSKTDLGRWTGMETDEETGLRILKWENGARCWNGPQRSATVFVRCGALTRVMSAEEPDTCRYELEMESPIACDDALKKQLEL